MFPAHTKRHLSSKLSHPRSADWRSLVRCTHPPFGGARSGQPTTGGEKEQSIKYVQLLRTYSQLRGLPDCLKVCRLAKRLTQTSIHIIMFKHDYLTNYPFTINDCVIHCNYNCFLASVAHTVLSAPRMPSPTRTMQSRRLGSVHLLCQCMGAAVASKE